MSRSENRHCASAPAKGSVTRNTTPMSNIAATTPIAATARWRLGRRAAPLRTAVSTEVAGTDGAPPRSRRRSLRASAVAVIEQLQEAAPIETQQLTVGLGPHRRGAGLVGEQGHLAEVVAGAERVDPLLAALLIVREHGEAAAGDDEQRVGDIALFADRAAGGRDLRLDVRGEARERHTVESGDDVDAAQEIALFVGPGRHERRDAIPRSSVAAVRPRVAEAAPSGSEEAPVVTVGT